MDSNTEYMMSVWLSGNVVGCVKEVTPCQVKLVLICVTILGYTILKPNNQANSLFIPLWVGKMSTDYGYGYQ